MNFKYENPVVVFKGRRIDVVEIDVLDPKGRKVKREVVDHPGAVVILPLLDNGDVVLIRNERYVVQQTLWELPAGTIDEGEAPEACAERELEEETGYRAGKLEPLFDCFSTPGFSNEILHIFLAENLHHVGQSLEEMEKIDVEPLHLDVALKMIREGIIRDAKTIAALLFFYAYRQKHDRRQKRR